MNDAIQKFLKFAQDKHLDIPTEVHIDGRIRKFNAGKNQGKKNPAEWYVLNYAKDGEIFGSIGSFREDVIYNFFSSQSESVSLEQREEMRKIQEENYKSYEAEKKILQDKAAEKAKYLWGIAEEAPIDFPYLEKKKISSNGIKYLPQTESSQSCLIVPMYNQLGQLRNLQRIYADGSKRNLSCAEAAGCFYVNGKLKHATHAYITEGWADAETVTLATGTVSVVAFGNSNLFTIAAFIQYKFPSCTVSLCIDNDDKMEATKEEWDERIGTDVYIPTEKDFSDVYTKHGLDAVRKQLQPLSLFKLTAKSIMDMQFEPLKFKVDNLIMENCVHIIYGPPGSGKSFYTLDMCISMAEGLPFMGRSVEIKQRVLYLDHEMGLQMLKPRLDQLYSTKSMRPSDANDNLVIAPYCLLSSFGLDLTKKRTKDLIEKELRNFDVVVFDNYFSLVPAVEHDKAHMSWRDVFDWLKNLAKIKGKTFIFVHHATKDGGQMSGSAAMSRDADIIIKVTKDEEKDYLSIITEIVKPRTILPQYTRPIQQDLQETGWVITTPEKLPRRK